MVVTAPRHVAELSSLLSPGQVRSGELITDDYSHDESLTEPWRSPGAVVLPRCTAEVVAIVEWANANRVSLTPRGSGTGLSGAAIAQPGAVLVSLEEMSKLIEVDVDNQVAVVQPGVTLAEIDHATEPYGLTYAVYPGEMSATVGGNIATNAGGMRAVRYGVTRHNVLGLEAVLGNGGVVRSGGKFVKATSGYDLTQLLIGSEGTLGIVTEATLKLVPRPEHSTMMLAPFRLLSEIATVAGKVVGKFNPTIFEFIDRVSLAGILAAESFDLSLPDDVVAAADAYLLIVMENASENRLQEDVEILGNVLADLHALDIFVLPSHVAADLIRARERAFFTAKARGADDIVDMVVPRAQMVDLFERLAQAAERHLSVIVGCGHIGDGNVHLSVFQPDKAKRRGLMDEIIRIGCSLGGAVSGEHGIGTAKQRYFIEYTGATSLAVQRQIKQVFDPHGILNLGVLFPPSGHP